MPTSKSHRDLQKWHLYREKAIFENRNYYRKSRRDLEKMNVILKSESWYWKVPLISKKKSPWSWSWSMKWVGLDLEIPLFLIAPRYLYSRSQIEFFLYFTKKSPKPLLSNKYYGNCLYWSQIIAFYHPKPSHPFLTTTTKPL